MGELWEGENLVKLLRETTVMHARNQIGETCQLPSNSTCSYSSVYHCRQQNQNQIASRQADMICT